MCVQSFYIKTTHLRRCFCFGFVIFLPKEIWRWFHLFKHSTYGTWIKESRRVEMTISFYLKHKISGCLHIWVNRNPCVVFISGCFSSPGEPAFSFRGKSLTAITWWWWKTTRKMANQKNVFVGGKLSKHLKMHGWHGKLVFYGAKCDIWAAKKRMMGIFLPNEELKEPQILKIAG